jgi:hypothetical protein
MREEGIRIKETCEIMHIYSYATYYRLLELVDYKIDKEDRRYLSTRAKIVSPTILVDVV